MTALEMVRKIRNGVAIADEYGYQVCYKTTAVQAAHELEEWAKVKAAEDLASLKEEVRRLKNKASLDDPMR